MGNSHVKEEQIPREGRAIPTCRKIDSLVKEILEIRNNSQ